MLFYYFYYKIINRTQVTNYKRKGLLFAFALSGSLYAQETDKGKDVNLDEIVIIGTRTAPRTNVSSPLPVDNFSVKDLVATGQATFDKAMQYRVPSFNTVNTPVNDATAFFDPWEIRNLGPSRTLVLINGKRKNISSLLLLQYSPGRGESGADLSAIPTDAIKSVEFLRDGASAQYGSDAIAGVINIKLKDRFNGTNLSIQTGVTSKGDGANYSASVNTGSNFGEKGFINFTAQFQRAETAVRSGNVTAEDDSKLWNTNFFNIILPNQPEFAPAAVASFLKNNPTAGNVNGTGESTSAKFLVNTEIPVNETTSFYANAAVVAKEAKNNALYRVPYWPGRGTFQNGFNGLIGTVNGVYVGFAPTFEGTLLDYNGSLGLKKAVTDGWNSDLSLTIGGNTQNYTVNNSINPSYEVKSPTTFKPGGYDFHHLVGNMDFNRNLSDKISVGFGSEFRLETFRIIAGDVASYDNQGAQSFTGNEAKDATTNTRNNLGVYGSMDFTPTKDFILSGTIRYEKYSDFGNAFVWKASSRYTFAEGLSIRASVSTGFKAPSLQQIYQQGRFSTFTPGAGVDLARLYNNSNPLTKSLGIPSLKAENAINYTAGITFVSPSKKISASLDYYKIGIKDRIVLTSILQNATTLGNAEAINGAHGGVFFINGVETATQGLDLVTSYRNIALGSGKLNINLGGNFTLQNAVVGEPNTPKPIADSGLKIFNEEARYLITKSRPAQKVILGFDYDLNKLHVNLGNTLFGKTQFIHDAAFGDLIFSPDVPLAEQGIAQEFKPAVVTDLGFGYELTKKMTIHFTINNIFNILPSWKLVGVTEDGKRILAGNVTNNVPPPFKGSPAQFTESVYDSLSRGITIANRFPITGKNGSQFSQLGTQFFLSLVFKI